MFLNYLKVAFRNMVMNKTYSFINVTGLAIGMAASILILLWVYDELSYDKFHKNADNIYRVVENQFYSGSEPFPVAVTPHPLAEALKDEFPEIVNSVKLQFGGGILKYDKKIITEKQNIVFTNNEFFEIFSYPFVRGNPQTALTDPNSIVLTEKIAKKYFPSEEPLGKIINFENKVNLKVTGVIESVPDNSHLQFDFIVSINVIIDLMEPMAEMNLTGWGTNCIFTYVQLQDSTPYEVVSNKISGTIKKHCEGCVSDIYLQPLTEIHLYSSGQYAGDVKGHGDIFYVEIFCIIAVFIIIIACINFVNLTTAKSAHRAKEIGIRKAVGSNKSSIILQFLGEAIVFSFFALLLALVIVELLLPHFNILTQKNFSFSSDAIIGILISLFLYSLITGILSGIYPALILSSFRPSTVFKGSHASSKKGGLTRKALVIFQFCISIMLIIGTLVVYKQLNYIHNKNLGLDKENVIIIPLDETSKAQLATIKREFLNNPDVDAVTFSSQLPTNIESSSSEIHWEGKNPDETILFHCAFVDQGFAKTLRLDISEGRFFSEDFKSDSNTLLVNEEAARIIGKDSIIGKDIFFFNKSYKVIGVLNNFHFKPLNAKIEPIILFNDPSWPLFNFIMIRIKPNDIKSTLASLEETFNQIVQGNPFEYQFLSDDYKNMYGDVERAGSVLVAFSVLAIIISCLGLFGLASFISEQRTKEIGVRKVLGASLSDLVILLSKEFISCVLAASLIAWPIAYFAMIKWLENYAYRIELSLWIFVIPAVIAIVISLTTVSYHAVKAALTDPVRALRYE